VITEENFIRYVSRRATGKNRSLKKVAPMYRRQLGGAFAQQPVPAGCRRYLCYRERVQKTKAFNGKDRKEDAKTAKEIPP
jgi:hypothetical protein